MPLTCECPYEDDCEWYWETPRVDYVEMPVRARRKRCQSCDKVINHLATCVEFTRFSFDECGDEIPLASRFMCESCGDLFWSLHELGFCVGLGENMRELAKEYAEVYVPGAAA